MASITVGFDNMNSSIQVGDVLYFLNNDEKTLIGSITELNGNTITATIEDTAPRPEVGDYFFFAKDNTINSSGMLGYYADTKFINISTEKAELYAINSEINLSSN